MFWLFLGNSGEQAAIFSFHNLQIHHSQNTILLYNNTQRHLSHQSSNIYNTILYIRLLWSEKVNDNSVEKPVLVRSQMQLIPNRKELDSFFLHLTAASTAKATMQPSSYERRFRVHLDILQNDITSTKSAPEVKLCLSFRFII